MLAVPTKLGSKGALILSYYQPWVYAGSERYNQLAIEELRQGRSQAYVYVADADDRLQIARNVRAIEYARFALYQFIPPDRVMPMSPYAVELSGQRELTFEELVVHLQPEYVRAHFPVQDYIDALESPSFQRIPFLYDVMDLWDEFVQTPWGNSFTEERYIKRSDAVTVVSQLLLDRIPEGFNKYLVPNAIDRVFLERIAPPRTGRLRPHVLNKRVLYMGSMGGSWFDWDLVWHLTHELHDHEFTFLGSIELPPEELDIGALTERIAIVKELKALPNVKFAPEVPHDDLVPWLRQADVGLIPFKPSNLTTAVSPLKVFEYLGAGAVVVQTGMPDIASYPGVRTAENAAGFVELVRVSDWLKLTAKETSAMVRFSERNTWAARVAQLDQIVDALQS